MKTRHIIAIGLLTATAIGLLAIGINKSKNQPKNYETKAEIQPTTLVNSTWEIKNTPTLENFTYSVNFTSNNQNFTILVCNNFLSTIQYSTTLVYNNNTWTNTNYKTIKFTGGSQITNNNLRTWLSNNATLISYDPNNNIYDSAYTEGETAGYTEGYDVGYGIGYNDSEAFNHPIDLMPTMLNILTMPFTFISQAFDVTLWPNTQYQINIGNFIKAIIAISAILFIIKLFTTGFSIIGNYTSSRTNTNLKRSQTKLNNAKTQKIKQSTKKE